MNRLNTILLTVAATIVPSIAGAAPGKSAPKKPEIHILATRDKVMQAFKGKDKTKNDKVKKEVKKEPKKKKIEKKSVHCDYQTRKIKYPNRFIQCEYGKWALVKSPEKLERGTESDSYGRIEGEASGDEMYLTAKRDFYERNNPLTNFEYDEIELNNRSSDPRYTWEQRMARIRIGQKWGIMDVQTGQVIIKPLFDRIDIPGLSSDKNLQSGWVRVSNGNRSKELKTWPPSAHFETPDEKFTQ